MIASEGGQDSKSLFWKFIKGEESSMCHPSFRKNILSLPKVVIRENFPL